MACDNENPSPRNDSPDKAAAEQKLKRMHITQKILGLSLIFTVATFYASMYGRWAFTLNIVLLMMGMLLVLLNMIHGIRRGVYERSSRTIREICTKCKYDLAGLDEPERCPECGTKIDRPPGSNML